MAKSHRNSFGALRICAASAVILSHAFQIATGNYSLDPVWRVSNGDMTLGGLAVAVFFCMSGWLVMGSWERRPDWYLFAWARFLRIWPALTVVLLLSVLVLGPLVTTAPDYWSHPATWNYLHLFGLRYSGNNLPTLPGVFVSLPVPKVVNGPLWTLEYEVGCYLMLLLLGVTRLLDRRTALMLATVLCVVWCRIPQLAHSEQTWMDLPRYFAVGVAMYLWRELIPWRRDLALLAVLLMAALMAWGELSTFGPPLLGYATLYLARSARLAGWDRWGDPSYGLYILAFPLQQLTAQLGARVWWANLLGVLPMALALAYASWHLIESPALHLKDRFPFQGSRQRSGALPTSAD